MVLIINIIGAPCSGKSTLACELFVEMKKRHFNVEYVNEFIKNLIWKNKTDYINDQYYIARKQYKIINSVAKKVDYVICDSPLFNSVFYNNYNENNISNVQKTKDFILDKIKELENISVYIFLNRDKTFPFSQIGRIHDSKQSSEIELLMKRLAKDMNIDYIETNTGEDVNNLLKMIIK